MFTINEIDVDELSTLMEAQEKGYVVIDVRSPVEVSQGIIPGADHVPLHLLPLRLHELPQDKKVVFYCRTGARSAQACAYAANQGKDNTVNLRGGIMAWVRGGKAVA